MRNLERILFISNLYPNPTEPHRAAFSRQQIAALNELVPVDIIAPVAWTKSGRNNIPDSRMYNGMEIFHPTYWYTPRVFRGSYGAFYLASIRKVAEHLLANRKYDLIYVSWLFPDGWAAAKLAEKYSLPFAVGVVGTDVNRLHPGAVVTSKSLWVVDRAATVVAVSQNLKDRLIEFGAKADKITVLDNGVDRSIFRPMYRAAVRNELGIPATAQLILFVGNLLKEKGLGELGRAFGKLINDRALKDLELIIIGSGPFKLQMHNILVSEGVGEHVRFLGTRTQREIAMWMNASDVFCLPSYSEGQPNVVLEAMACGVRTVASRVGGIPELYHGQRSLRLVEPRSVDLLSEGLEDMLKADLKVVEIDHIWSWQENAACIVQIFEGLIKCKG